MTKQTLVYTDGACRGNPGPGGWAWAIPGGRFSSGAEAASTNQRMEVYAVLDAVRNLDGPLLIRSDSTYVVNCFRDRWWEGWIKRGWRNSQKQPVANRELWEPLIELVRARMGTGAEVDFAWVKGHSGDPMNDLVDKLAVRAALTGEPWSGNSPPSATELDALPADTMDPTAASKVAPARTSHHGAGSAIDRRVPAGFRLVVGGLGAADLAGSEATVERRLAEILAAKAELHPNLVVMTGLRLGAERLGATAAVQAGVPYVAVLPWPDPAARWSPEERRAFEVLLAGARDVVTLEKSTPRSVAERNDAFTRRDGWLARWAEDAVVVWDHEEAAAGEFVRRLQRRLPDDVWILEPEGVG